MIAMLCAAILFALFLTLGVILMFVTTLYYWLIPVFLVFLIILRLFYRRPNCHSLEGKDFVFTFIITAAFCLMLTFYFNERINVHNFTFLYLITFVSVLMFADSIRFKSLM